ncbi:MAG: VTT domain-containing protein [Patescibacteria group bacterium]|nr:VTT domain-containing protein [Patescibacteria group bacterium]MDE1945695.1 VTT domain-containing protein [Patescibacteria group bacterium]
MHSLLALLEPVTLIKTLGVAGLFFAVFAESGLFFGFFFPGDSLLFTAGFLASQGILNITVIVIGSFLCAVIGDSVGYWFGREVGPKIFHKENSFFFNKRYIDRTKDFYAKYGNKTIFLARFVPIVRTFAPILAGVGGMSYRAFLSYNVAGGFAWSVGVLLAGFFLGKAIPGIDGYLLPIVLVIIAVSFIPIVLEMAGARRKGK